MNRIRRCKVWEFKVAWTFDGLFMVSICNLVRVKDQILHFLIHFIVGLAFGSVASIFFALGFEIRDGELNRIKGFSIFPDLLIRTSGAVAGGILKSYYLKAIL